MAASRRPASHAAAGARYPPVHSPGLEQRHAVDRALDGTVAPGQRASRGDRHAVVSQALGMLYARTGQQEQARPALSTAIAWYRAMAMMFWLP